MPVGGDHAGEQGNAFQAVSWCQSFELDFVIPFILKALEPDKLPLKNGNLLIAGMAASY
jgi:hypothetical protein